jgi:hypothetical protein
MAMTEDAALGGQRGGRAAAEGEERGRREEKEEEEAARPENLSLAASWVG